MKVIATLVLVAMLAVADAHICLTYPMQRGPHPRLTPGDSACFNRVPDCGALPKGDPTAKFEVGPMYTLSFQQNLNHWYAPDPGYFDLAISYDDKKSWNALGAPVSDFPANNMNTQTFFDVPVVFDQPAASAIIRARYVSHNKYEIDPANNTEAIFYSCADVEITLPNGTIPKSSNAFIAAAPQKVRAPRQMPAAGASESDCTTPSKWVATGLTFSKTDLATPVLGHTIHYDADAGWVRWNRNNTFLGGNYDITDLWNLTLANAGYTPQYIVGISGPNTCSLYGGDKFVPWQYGPQAGMSLRFEMPVTGGKSLWYAIDSADFEFAAFMPRGETSKCLPASMRHGMLSTDFDAKEVSSIPSSVFDIPQVCLAKLRAHPDGGCKGHKKQ